MKVEKITSIPRLMLLLVIFALTMWTVIVPMATGVASGRGEWLQWSLCCSAFIPVGLFVLWFGRLIVYALTLLWWYVLAFAAALLIAFGILATISLFAVPGQVENIVIPLNRLTDPTVIMNLVPTIVLRPEFILVAAAAVLLFVALLLIIRPRKAKIEGTQT